MLRYIESKNSVSLVVKTLLIVNVLIFLLEMYFADLLISNFALWPIDSSIERFNFQRPGFQIQQLVTYAFLHGSFTHIILNMYALWIFGSRIENLWGAKTFAIYYFVCVIGAAFIQLIVSSQGQNHYPTIGASGGVFGVLLAFGMFFPHERLMLIFPPIPIQARTFVIMYGIIELWFGVTGTAQGIAHFAHLGGMLFGFSLIQFWKRSPPT